MSEAWVQTWGGECFDLLEPEAGQVFFADIAHALSNICRFNGHCTRFYSVAEHSVVMSRLVPSDLARWALFHDATEAYVGDMVRPLKEILPAFKRIEEGVARAIAKRFGLGDRPAALRVHDLRMLATEAEQLMDGQRRPWGSLQGVAPFDVALPCWPPQEAARQFFARFGEIEADRVRREKAAA